MSGVLHASHLGLHDVQSNSYTFILIAANYKNNKSQYLRLADNSIVTNTMWRSSFLNNNRFSDRQEISRILWNPVLPLSHSQEKSNNPYPDPGKPSSCSPVHLSIVIPSTPSASQWSVSIKLLRPNVYFIFILPHAHYMHCPFLPP